MRKTLTNLYGVPLLLMLATFFLPVTASATFETFGWVPSGGGYAKDTLGYERNECDPETGYWSGYWYYEITCPAYPHNTTCRLWFPDQICRIRDMPGYYAEDVNYYYFHCKLDEGNYVNDDNGQEVMLFPLSLLNNGWPPPECEE